MGKKFNFVYITANLINGKQYIKQIIKGYLLWFLYYVYKPYRDKIKKEAKERINICEHCEHFTKTRQCNICRCYMEIKTKMYFELDEEGKSINGCVEKKW